MFIELRHNCANCVIIKKTMGYIKEPKGVDLIVGPSTLTEKEKKMISDIIVRYKLTGKKTRSSKLPERTKPSTKSAI